MFVAQVTRVRLKNKFSAPITPKLILSTQTEIETPIVRMWLQVKKRAALLFISSNLSDW